MALPSITISGYPGAGKSTVAKLLKKILNYQRHNTGDFFRDLHKQEASALSFEEYYSRTGTELNKKADEMQLQRIIEGNWIVEGRYAGAVAYKHALDNSFRVFMYAAPNVCAKRIEFREGNYSVEKVIERIEVEKQKCLESVGLDYTNKELYSTYIDTSGLYPNAICNKIISDYRVKTENNLALTNRY